MKKKKMGNLRRSTSSRGGRSRRAKRKFFGKQADVAAVVDPVATPSSVAESSDVLTSASARKLSTVPPWMAAESPGTESDSSLTSNSDNSDFNDSDDDTEEEASQTPQGNRLVDLSCLQASPGKCCSVQNLQNWTNCH